MSLVVDEHQQFLADSARVGAFEQVGARHPALPRTPADAAAFVAEAVARYAA